MPKDMRFQNQKFHLYMDFQIYHHYNPLPTHYSHQSHHQLNTIQPIYQPPLFQPMRLSTKLIARLFYHMVTAHWIEKNDPYFIHSQKQLKSVQRRPHGHADATMMKASGASSNKRKTNSQRNTITCKSQSIDNFCPVFFRCAPLRVALFWFGLAEHVSIGAWCLMRIIQTKTMHRWSVVDLLMFIISHFISFSAVLEQTLMQFRDRK